MASTVIFKDFKPDSAGISELFCSAGMQALCDQAATKVCTTANGSAVSMRATIPNQTKGLLKHRDSSAFATLPYAKKTKVLTHTVIGVVYPATIEGAYDNNQHHTLSRVL